MKGNDLFKYILGGLIVIGFFVLLYLLVMSEIPEKNKDLLNLVVGALIGSFASVVGYYFGSSAGSAKKDDLLQKKQGDTL
jgi:heme O synthase-like polyprenyltransferase